MSGDQSNRMEPTAFTAKNSEKNEIHCEVFIALAERKAEGLIKDRITSTCANALAER